MNVNLNKFMGFSLIELLVCLAILSILAALTYPNYTHFMTQSYRAQAQQNLLILAKNIEQYRTIHKNYLDATIADLNDSSIQQDHHYHYEIQGLTVNSYELAAIPNSTQAKNDPHCGTLLFNQLGEKKITGTKNAKDCWF